MGKHPPPDLLPVLLARRSEFIGFLAARLNHNRADAEDVLQHGLVKALATAGTLRDDEHLLPWFYQLLRHAVVDHIRSRRAAADREHRWSDEALPAPETTARLCACIEPLIATLPPAQATLIRRAELAGEPVASVAASLGLTPNAASVALHRARASLRAKLQSFCGDCASGACLDCDCE
ncbi:MAG: polymerase, sigma-24 subunit, subfamily [Rariglobus sp.]|jgi:RNA polymerase sigma-70 factor (ECF subfamily)|nr:polymerase, sigma-24 subunit, subfamily [Rariglobus sp.]